MVSAVVARLVWQPPDRVFERIAGLRGVAAWTVVIRQIEVPSRLREKPLVGIQCADNGIEREQMTWIKPSFLWMMYRSGWATKPDQEHVLAIEIPTQVIRVARGSAELVAVRGGERGSRTRGTRSVP